MFAISGSIHAQPAFSTVSLWFFGVGGRILVSELVQGIRASEERPMGPASSFLEAQAIAPHIEEIFLRLRMRRLTLG
jgi:hypothetical protein